MCRLEAHYRLHHCNSLCTLDLSPQIGIICFRKPLCCDGVAGDAVDHLQVYEKRSSSLASRHRVSGYFNRRSGKWVHSYTRRNRGRRPSPPNPPRHASPFRPQKPPTPRKLSKTARITVVATISVIFTIGGIIFGPKIFNSGSGGTGSGSSEVGGEGKLTVNGSTVNVQAKFTHATATLSASGFGGYIIPAFDDNCESHSYGHVQGFFKSNPCKWLARAYIVVHETKQDAVLVAISWVDMPTLSLAMDYKRLVDKPDTGNINELSRESGPYRIVVFNGDYYQSGIVGTAVWNVQVQPVGSISANILKTVLDDSLQ